MRKKGIVFLLCLLLLVSCGEGGEKKKLLRDLDASEKTEYGIILNAMNNISKAPFAEAIERLIELTGSENAKVRTAAVETLKAYGDIIVPDLAKALTSEYTNDLGRQSALDLIINIGAPALPAMRNVMKTADPFTKLSIINVLGEIGDPGVTVDLLEFLDSDDGNIVIAAAKALGKLKAGEASGKLLELLKSEDSNIKLAAVQSLVEIGKPESASVIISSLKKDDDPDFLLTAIKAVIELGKGQYKIEWATRILAPIFKYENADVRVMAESAYLESLCKYDEGVRMMEFYILEKAYHPFPAYMGAFVDSLRKVGKNAKSEEALKKLLKIYNNPLVLVKVYGALISYGLTEYKDKMLELVKSNDLSTVEEVIFFAKMFNYSEVCSYMPELLAKPIYDITVAALGAAKYFKCDSALAWMEKELFGNAQMSWELKEKALDAISAYPYETVKSVLSKALNEGDPYIQFYAEKIAASLQKK